jgi:Transglutaminase-like superfamily
MLSAVVAKRKLRRFLALPLREKCWCFFALWLLGLARLMVLLLPASVYSQRFGRDMGILPLSVLVSEGQRMRARRIGNAIAAIANITPWRSLCLEQALAAQFLLCWYRIPSVVYFGLARDASASMRAHAWTCSGPVFVTGGNSFAQFTVVRNYVARSSGVVPAIAATAGQTTSAAPPHTN